MCAVAGFAGQTMPVQSVPTNDVIPDHIRGRVEIGDVEIAANVDRAGVGNGAGAGAIQGPERRPIRSIPSGKASGGDAAGVCETPERVKVRPASEASAPTAPLSGGPFSPAPNADHTLPFHLATLSAGTLPPTVVNLPPTYSSSPMNCSAVTGLPVKPP